MPLGRPPQQPTFPKTFGCIEDAKIFCRIFFDWYNQDHHHAGIGLKWRGVAANASPVPWDNGTGSNWGGDMGHPSAAAAEGDYVLLGWHAAEAGTIERAVVDAIEAGETTTDLGGSLGTKAAAKAVLKRLAV